MNSSNFLKVGKFISYTVITDSTDSRILWENILSKKSLLEASMHLWAFTLVSPTINVTSANLPVSSIFNKSFDMWGSGT